jgi:hypothetical protein
MRRGFSIFLILIFGLGPLSSLIDGSENANLPACCRRSGSHHCAMAMQMAAMQQAQPDKSPGVSAPITCPYYPGAANAIFAPQPALAAMANSTRMPAVAGFLPAPARSTSLATPARTHAGRGPPSSNLS